MSLSVGSCGEAEPLPAQRLGALSPGGNGEQWSGALGHTGLERKPRVPEMQGVCRARSWEMETPCPPQDARRWRVSGAPGRQLAQGNQVTGERDSGQRAVTWPWGPPCSFLMRCRWDRQARLCWELFPKCHNSLR